VHYANAILHYTSYESIIAIGMTDYKDHNCKLQYEIGVYCVSNKNYGFGQEIGKYKDFSFLKKENFDDFTKKIKSLYLSEQEKQIAIEQRENEIDANLVKLNNDILQKRKRS